MMDNTLGHLYTLMVDSCPPVLQAPVLTNTWLGPVLGAAVGALAVLGGSFLTVIVTLRGSWEARLERHNTVKREALSELLALTYQMGTGEIDAQINTLLSRLKLLLSPRKQGSIELLTHLDALYANSNLAEWRKRFVSLALQELQ